MTPDDRRLTRSLGRLAIALAGICGFVLGNFMGTLRIPVIYATPIWAGLVVWVVLGERKKR